MTDDYSEIEGYNPEADLGLGCGLPTEYARIKPGDIVLDLGSGAGNDCFIARSQTGETGKVIGIDFTEAMITKARTNAEKLGFHNVEFRQGDIESMPVSANVADVIVSNCVLNLVPNKKNVFNDMFRVLKSGGHFSISDVVHVGQLPEKITNAAVMYSGCIGGTVPKSEYLKLIKDAGFDTITVQKEKPIIIPDDILRTYLSVEEIEAFNNSDNGIYSITVFGRKPDCCIPDSGCC